MPSLWWYSIMLTKNPFYDIANTKRLALIEAESSSLFVDQGCYLVRDTYALFDTTAISRLRTGVMCSCHLFSLLQIKLSYKKNNIPGMLLSRDVQTCTPEDIPVLTEWPEHSESE